MISAFSSTILTSTGWNDNVLQHHYYSGLAKHIKDIMGQQGKPLTLTKMKLLAHAIDSRHREWLCERSHPNNPQPKPKNKPKSTSKNKSDPSNNPARHTCSASSSNHTDTPATPSPSGNSIANKLGNDGKLTPKECQWHFDNDLCLYCGGTGHKSKKQLHLLPKRGPMWLKPWKKTKKLLLKVSLLMRSHHLWPWKLQNRTIPVNLEAIQTTTISSRLFWMLYLGYNQVLHYIVYGLQLSNLDISSASSDLSAIFKYILKKSNYLQSP